MKTARTAPDALLAVIPAHITILALITIAAKMNSDDSRGEKKMKNFNKPSCEVVRFDNNVIATSGGCPCDCDFDDYGLFAAGNCTADRPAGCKCKVNYNPAEDNCIEM